MRAPPFTLHSPGSIDEVLSIVESLNEQGKSFDWIAGGTDLLPNYKWHINVKSDVISLARVEGISEVSATEIGAMARLSDIESSEYAHPLIKKAASKVASSLIRKNATLGGNLCLDTRCFWFNQSEEWRQSIDWCHKCDCDTGADCRVIPNQNELCVATFQGDVAPALMALGATIHLLGPKGAREMPLEEFYSLDGITRNVLLEDEMVLKVTLSEQASSLQGSYQKLRVRESWDFPEAGIAAAWDGNNLSSLRVASTALESIPRLHEIVDSEDIPQQLFKEIKPVNNTFLPPRYRRSMIKVLTKRALKEIGV